MTNFRTQRGLARSAGIKHAQLVAILNKIEGNYRLFRIPKRSGGLRSISIPRPALKALQATILRRLESFPVSDQAHAFCAGRSIKSHAALHLRSTDFVKVDLKDFFPSIRADAVFETFLSLGFEPGLAQAMTRLTTFMGGLPQGAPSSPIISNLVMRKFDASLAAFADTHGLIYSRYADDIVVSGKSIDVRMSNLALDIIQKLGFEINFAKTRLMRSPSKIILTGISISEGQTKIPKEYKRSLRQQAYNLLRKGNPVSLDGGRRVDPFLLDRVLGRLSFWSFVEPQASFPKRYMAMLSSKYLSR